MTYITRVMPCAAACSNAKAREAKVFPPPVGTVRVYIPCAHCAPRSIQARSAVLRCVATTLLDVEDRYFAAFARIFPSSALIAAPSPRGAGLPSIKFCVS